MLFDTHLHFYPEDDIPAILARARAAGVGQFAVIGADMPGSRRAVSLAKPADGVFAVVGQHPHSSKDFLPEQLAEYRTMAATPGVVAVGEIGLDYHYEYSPRVVQRQVFVTFLRLSLELGLPPVLHCREAGDDCLAILRDEWPAGRPFIVHSFTGEPEWALAAVELGAAISFNGIITFKKADNVRAALAAVPRDRLLLETDSPYLAPEPHRGQRNEPAYLVEVARRAAQLFSLTETAVGELTTANARRFFAIP